MKRFFKILMIILFTASCSPKIIVQEKNVEKITYRDSIIQKVDTCYVQLPNEKNETVMKDSSFLETSIAESTAFVDDDGFLHHSLNNKNVELPIKIIKEKEIFYVDTTIYIEKPIVTEKIVKKIVPNNWIILIIVLMIVLFIIKKFK